MRRLLLSTILVLSVSAPVLAQQRDTLMRADMSSVRGKAVLFSTIGSAAGMIVGGVGATAICRGTGWGDSGEDPCLGQLLLGGLAGSILGAAIGAHLPTRNLGGRFSLGPALGGTVVGLGVGFLGGQLTDGPGGFLIPFAVAQGVVTGLLTTRSRGP